MPVDYATLGSAAIAGDSPAGANVRYDPDFDRLKGEVGKLDSVNPDVKWSDVVEMCSAILSTKSKDLLIGAYLTAALLHTQGYKGLALGLRVCKDMCATYWQTMFPEVARLKGREAALTWLTERCEKVWPELKPPERSDEAPLNDALTAVQELMQAVMDKFPGEGPNLPLLERLLREKIALVPPPPPEPSATPEATTQPQTTTETAAAAPAKREINSASVAREALPELQSDLVKAAQYLQKENPADPLPYRLLRIALWGQVLDPTPALNGGDVNLLPQWDKRLETKDYPGLLAECEARLATEPFWIDANYYSCRAMEGMGYMYEAARKVIGEEVAALVRRMPVLLTANLNSGIPAAGPAVRVWITNELLAGKSQGAAPNRLDEKLREARTLVARKQLAEAVTTMMTLAREAPSRRERFLARLNAARLCLEAGKPAQALPMLDSLDSEAQKYILEEWEPSLCTDLLKCLWEAHKALGTGDTENTRKLYARLSSLDLVAALTLDGK